MTDNIFQKLNNKGNCYYITNKITYQPFANISSTIVNTTFDFAYDMTFAQRGQHRDHRTGGTHQRRNGEIFANTFQGKLAEFALYTSLSSKKIDISQPDLSVYGLGKWDSVDFIINGKNVSIKSTKSFGNLLLLEENDWDENACYLPSQKCYDFTFLIRMNPFCEDLLRRNRLLFSDEINKDFLYNIIINEKWQFDIPGFITKFDLIDIIQNKYIIPKNALLNGKTKMDASNYYVQSGDMRSLDNFIDELKK